MNRKLLVLAVAALVLPACARSINPKTQALTDELLQQTRQARDVGAPDSWDPKPWRVGQWALYKSTQDGKDPQITRIMVVEQTGDGYWLESEQLDYYGRTLTRTLYARQPRSAEEAIDVLRKIITRQDDAEPVEQDFTEDNQFVAMMKRAMKHVANGVVAPSDAAGLPKEDAAVPAGLFRSAAKFQGSIHIGPVEKHFTGWFHPEVPMGGAVKTVDAEGKFVQELLDYGDTGAASLF